MPEIKRIWGTLDPFYEPGPVLGRKVANIKFLGALLSENPFDEYHFFLMDDGQIKSLDKHVKKIAPEMMKAGRIKLHHRRDLPEKLASIDFYCFHLSDCMTSQPYMTRMRNKVSRRIFPVTGTIHSLSYANFGSALLRHLWPGTTRRDAIVCTSSLGLQTVENFFAWLREGYGLTEATHPAPQLSQIPLGVTAEEFLPGKSRSEDRVVRLLVFGRISHYSKMDLVPLVRALHRLVQDGMDPGSLELVLAGWVDDKDEFLPKFKGMVANVGVSLTVHVRPDEAEKVALFQSSDIFISIADNPQETFGITLIEAGAFGLPTIASEYDGYRDIIVDGETGLLVPTMGPAETPDVDLLSPITYDNQYHLMLAQRTVVEIPALAAALKKLIESPDLRQTMGKAARERVLDKFTWSTVIQEYVALWDRLWAESVDDEVVRNCAHPQAIPYGRTFGHYTSQTLASDTMLKAGRTGEAFYRDKDFPTLYEGIKSVIDLDVIKKTVFFARKAIDTATLIRKLVAVAPDIDAGQAENHVLWALKHDILEHVK
jgi:glycosyltransferase involved in cell wall biosynthesis